MIEACAEGMLMAELPNGNGHRISIPAQISVGSLLTIASLGAGLLAAYLSLVQGQTRVEDRLTSIESRLEKVEKDHDSVTRLEDQVEELFGLYGKSGTNTPPVRSP